MIAENEFAIHTLSEMFMERRNEIIKGITFITGKSDESFYTYKDIYDQSMHVLGYLQSKGLTKGDKLIFQLNENYDFIHMFWACVLGGIVPVPIVAEEKDEFRRKLYNILLLIEGAYVVGRDGTMEKFKSYAEQENLDSNLLNDCYIHAEEAFVYGESGQVHIAKSEDIAMIQFSSGSTGMPKGVVLTHKNLLTNIDAIICGVQLNSEDVLVSWMPLTHDMGLIGCHLAVTAVNISQFTMNTMLFVMRPTIWLDKITEHKATLLASPNFGLKYAMMGLQRSRTKNYNFSSVRIIFNGAEPISPKICDEFLNKMSQYGMKSSVMFPVYGMAEATLAIAFPLLNEETMSRVIVNRNCLSVGQQVVFLQDENDAHAACYVDEGFPVKSCKVRICDYEDNILHAEILGIIQIIGDNVSEGYYCNDEANTETRTSDGWFRTGDIGFFHNDRIVVIGRVQDMVIVNGQNYFSTDLERIASEIEKVELNKVAVSSTIDRVTQTEKIIVFVVHKGDKQKFVPIIHKLRGHFARSIGINIDYIVPVKQIPKTSSGKLMRFSLKEQFENGFFQEVMDQCNEWIESDRISGRGEYKMHSKNNKDVEQVIMAICHEVSPETSLGLHDNFFEYGINSLSLNQMAARLNDQYPGAITAEDFFIYSSIKKLSDYICGIEGAGNDYTAGSSNIHQSPKIAVIGMAGILPGADSIDEFWSNLCGAVESVGPLPSGRFKDLEQYLNSKGHTGEKIVKDSGFLYEIDKFDHEFFKILKREAIAMSPAQRLFLQTAYSSLENAGYGGDALKSSRTGVYVGYISDLDGYQYQDIVKQSQDRQTPTGTLSANISGRVSYFMDFKGPSVLVDSACSSSMSALNMACQGLYNGDCDQAVVGGVQLKVVPDIINHNIGIESSDGHTRPFAEDADGTGEGEGIVSILIKPYDQAVKDRDHIYGVILSTHTNQDGHSVGLSAPNPQAQTALIVEAMDKAKVKVSDITYIEAHGTGTKLGDPIEIRALTAAFESRTEQKQFCAIGSVKSNIGHLYASSGLVSIVKCCLMLENKIIPATVNIKKLNSALSIERSPFYVNLEYKKWDTDLLPRRCGVSNFGFSGTNCHAIMEEYVEQKHARRDGLSYPFVLSASNRDSLEKLVKAYYEHLRINPEISISDICYTASMGRGHYQYRLAILVNDTEDLINKLRDFHYSTQPSRQIYIGTIKMVRTVRKDIHWGELTYEDVQLLSQSTTQCISNYLENADETHRDALIERMCSLYVRGSYPAWNLLFENEDCNRVSLPIYQFKSTRCWPMF